MPIVIKSNKSSLMGGPVHRHINTHTLAPLAFYGYQNLDQIKDLVDSLSIPDFKEMHVSIVNFGINLSDDPLIEGLDYLKTKFAEINKQLDELVLYRNEVIAIKSEWVSMRSDFDRCKASEKRKLRKHPDYLKCKNAESRADFYDDGLNEYLVTETRIQQAIERCTSFIEVCRIKGKALEKSAIALDRQLQIIKLQIDAGVVTFD